MIKALISDVSRVLLFPTDKNYRGSLNSLHREMLSKSDYNFFDYFKVNKELLEVYKNLKKKAELYILTSETIQDAPELQPFWEGLFIKIYSASKMGISKKESSSYKLLLEDIKLKGNEVLYIDDNLDNLEAAKSNEIHTIQYINNESLLSELKEIL